MDWATFAIAALGLLTTLLAPLVQNWMTARRERAAWRRDRQTDAFADAMTYAQTLETMLERVTDPYATRQSKPDLAHKDLITSRMRMFAPDVVFDAWREIRRIEDNFYWNISEDGHSFDGAVPDDYPDVAQLRAAVQHFYGATRKIIGS
jgi:hypothetical protein